MSREEDQELCRCEAVTHIINLIEYATNIVCCKVNGQTIINKE
ncbi:MAG: hypothetical protein ACYDH9_23795 [Limisphaerales bacterium]